MPMACPTPGTNATPTAKPILRMRPIVLPMGHRPNRRDVVRLHPREADAAIADKGPSFSGEHRACFVARYAQHADVAGERGSLAPRNAGRRASAFEHRQHTAFDLDDAGELRLGFVD